jgi:hypothetical protein
VHGPSFFDPAETGAYSSKDFARLQRLDPWCVRLARRVDKGLESRATLSDEGILHVSFDDVPAVAVPLTLRAFVLRQFHTTPLAGHVGSDRTLAAIRRHFYWPGMWRDVRRWIKACHTCAVRKSTRPMHHGLAGIVCKAQMPWQTLGIDIVEASAVTSNGYKYILTCYDLFSRWAIAVPLQQRKWVQQYTMK